MDDLLNEIQAAVRGGLWIVALTSTLALPDICAAVGSEDGRTSGRQYRDWFEKYLGDEYPQIDAAELWQMRNSMLHQGNTSAKTYKRLLFIHPSSPMQGHKNVLNDAVNLDLPTFCSDVIAAVRRWEGDVRGTEAYKRNVGAVVRWHPNGLEPYMLGAPVLS